MKISNLIAEYGVEAKCNHCGTGENLTVDHIVSKLLKGRNALANYQILCQPCNSKKASRIPEGDIIHGLDLLSIYQSAFTTQTEVRKGFYKLSVILNALGFKNKEKYVSSISKANYLVKSKELESLENYCSLYDVKFDSRFYASPFLLTPEVKICTYQPNYEFYKEEFVLFHKEFFILEKNHGFTDL